MTQNSRFNLSHLSKHRLLISCGTGIILLMYAWLAEAWHQAKLPDNDHPIELYSTELQQDLSLIISRAIEDAQESVTLAIYALTDPDILRSLNNKSSSGCYVKVICDAKASSNVERKLAPGVKLLKRFFKDLMHLKVLIIDGRQVWIGSANMTRESLRYHGNLVTAIESQDIAEMVDAKMRSFTSTERMKRFDQRTFKVGDQSIELWFLPDDPRAVGRLKKLIQSAEKTIRIAMFTWTRRDLAQEVIAAKKRGIKVEVVLDRTAAMGSSQKIAKMLSDGGIKVKVNQGAPLLHHKFMQIDDQAMVNGSANWTLRAFSANDDCFLVLSPLSKEQTTYLDRLWKVIDGESKLLTLP